LLFHIQPLPCTVQPYHLIDKNKVNIYDIPIAMITEQYMEYVEQLKKEDLNVVSEFLVMAATLLDIKSRML
jgi:segregation and condensation protein A